MNYRLLSSSFRINDFGKLSKTKEIFLGRISQVNEEIVRALKVSQHSCQQPDSCTLNRS